MLPQSTAFPGNQQYTCRLVCAVVNRISHPNFLRTRVRVAETGLLAVLTRVAVYDARLVDIWACAIVFYCMQFQELPWRMAKATKDNESYLEYVKACQSIKNSHNGNEKATVFPNTINLLSPRQSRSCIRNMLEPDTKLRFTTEEIMKNAWFESIEVCYLVEKPTHKHALVKSAAENGAH